MAKRANSKDIEHIMRRERAASRRNEAAGRRTAGGYFAGAAAHGHAHAVFHDPLMPLVNSHGGIRTISPYCGRQVSYRVLRSVAQKAWIINVCIRNVIMKIRPYLKVSTAENQRGFRIKRKDAEKMSETERRTAKELADFMMKTGDAGDPYRKDDLDTYAAKLARDLLQLDQTATEIQRNHDGEARAFGPLTRQP